MEAIKKYLEERHTEKTTKRYLRDIQIFIDSHLEPERVKYKDMMKYVGELRKDYPNAETIKTIVAGISRYFDFLIHTGVRKDNPCKILNLKTRKDRTVRTDQLLTPEELKSIFENRYERYSSLVGYRNQVILSLLIYQALTNYELISLLLKDIDLAKGKVKINGSNITNPRILDLHNDQIMMFHKYISEERPVLLKRKKDPGILIITLKGNPENGEGISYLTSAQPALLSKKKFDPRIIRQSVIHNMFKEGHDVREIQLFAGHKYASTTESYKPKNDEEMREAIETYHPLG